MDFEEFIERFTEDVKTKLYESGLEVSATNNEVTKMNKSYNALTIKPDDSNIGVNLNLDYFYEAVENGVDYNSAVNTAVDAAKDGIAHSPEIEVGSLLNYEEMKGKLIMEVVSKDTNKDLLETVPHKDMEDFYPEGEIEYEQCEMCGNERIRYIHILTHPDYDGEMRVGCICASEMTSDYVNPKDNERSARNKANRRRNFLKKEWRYKPETGNYTLIYKGERITLMKSKYGPGWGVMFKGKWTWDYNGNKIYDLDKAKQVAFEVFDRCG